MEKIILNVWGMECGHCKAAVQKALMATKGVTEARVDLPTGKVSVTYDPAVVGRDNMVAAVKGAGYEVLKDPE